ncbi:MAG: hypothetical protein H6806_03885 [Planctomycetes bacterium]|nr:hypothetical protein [Planctomycetota bacterium]MCB9825006.1 hypothetical protein [Planctomycetota bacterium]MCB9828894.1 hypothetical protein [Planctomycetota bacterium]MCB9902025.1 hypothetical protein [Planctomycetota bacterium]
MPDIREVLVTAGSDAWPAILIAAVTGLFAVGLARGGVPRGARAVLALGLASAFCVGLSRIEAWPSLPLAAGESAWLWTAWIAVGAGVLAAIGHAVKVPLAARAVVALLFGGLATWLLAGPFVPHRVTEGERWMLVGLGGVATAVLAAASARASRNDERLDVAGVVWLVALTGLSLLLAIAASSAILGRATGLIAAALGTFLGVRFVLGGEAPSRALALPLAALLVSLCVSGWLSLNYEGHVGLPATAVAALVAGLVVALLVLLVKAMPLAARVVVVTLLVGGATFAAFRLVDAAKPPPSDDADEYDYSVFK